jgi:hypothetical protein
MVGCTKALVKGNQGRRGNVAFREIFTNFDQGSILDGIFTLVNGKLKLLGEFGRCFM